VFVAVVGMARCAVPDRVIAVGTNIRATLAFEGIAPLHAARTSQRDVPTTLNTYRASHLPQLLFLFAVLFFAGHCGRAQAKEVFAEFDQANKLYEEGKYSEAAAVYEKAVKAGQVSAALCFNLGNALFKAGQPGRALVWYRRAEALSPRDPDIQANLQFVRKNVAGGVNSRNWRARLQKLNLNEWTLLAVAALWLWFVLLALREWRPKLRPALRGYTSTVGLGGALLGICLAIVWYDYTHTTPAVVVVAEAVVRRGPLDESQSFYTLRDGSEITVLDQKNDWLQVIDQSKRIGWLRRDQVLVVRPNFEQQAPHELHG
jgi:tetratricopeptide (TPR) repeat protein